MIYMLYTIYMDKLDIQRLVKTTRGRTWRNQSLSESQKSISHVQSCAE